MPSRWNVGDFFTYYLSPMLAIGLYARYKIVKKNNEIKPEDTDLITGLDETEEHEMKYCKELEESGHSEDKVKKFFKWFL